MRRTFEVVEASPPARPVLRELAPRTGECFEALPDVDLAPWSDAEPDRAGAVEADPSEEEDPAELNVEAARTPEPAVPESALGALLPGEAVEAAP